MADRLAEIADELYAAPPDAFVPARAARLKALADDRALAARVKALRKPAAAAWVVNLLARARRDELERLFALGAELRAAQAALDRGEIVRLAREGRTAVTALTQEAARLAVDAGHTATPAVVDAVAATLDAGLADPEAADAIRTRRLVRPLQSIGFDPVDLAESVAAPEAGSRAAQRRVPERPRLVDDGNAELRRARLRADAVVTRAERQVAAAAEGLGALDVRLRAARKALATAQREAEALERRRDSAGEVLEKAREDLDAARTRRREFGG